MKIALTLALLGAVGYFGMILVDRSIYRPGLRGTPTWVSATGVLSFAMLALSVIAALICLIWGIA